MSWSFTKLVILLSLLVFTGLFWWLPDALVEPAIKLTGINRSEPDYWIQHFTITTMNDLGRPKYFLRAQSLVHFPNETSTRIDQPYLIQYDQGSEPLVTTADTGWVSPDGKQLLMTGNVKMARGSDPDFASAEVMSNKVTVTLN